MNEIAAVMRAIIEPLRAARHEQVIKQIMADHGVPRPEAEYIMSLD